MARAGSELRTSIERSRGIPAPLSCSMTLLIEAPGPLHRTDRDLLAPVGVSQLRWSLRRSRLSITPGLGVTDIRVPGGYLTIAHFPVVAEQPHRVSFPPLSWTTRRPAAVVLLQSPAGGRALLATSGTWR